MRRLLISIGLLFTPLLFAAGATVDLTNAEAGTPKPFYVTDVATNAVTTVLCPPNYKVTFSHTGFQSGASPSASAAGDYVVLQHQADTPSVDMSAGEKMLLYPNGGGTAHGYDIKTGTDGPYEVQLEAVGHAGKIQITCVPLEKGK